MPAGDVQQATAGESIEWTVPEGWTQLPAQEMRFAAFRVSEEHPDVLLTVIPLGPEAGDLRANVNRWEQQLGLPPTPADQMDKVVQHVDAGTAVHADVVDLTGPAAAEGKPQMRMLAAIVPTDAKVWFFKLAGPADVVATQKDNFDAFIRSIRFGETAGEAANGGGGGGAPPPSMPAGHPPVPGAAPNGAAPGGLNMSPDTEAALSWSVPQGWRQDPNPRAMRAATFYVGPEDSQAELIVSRLSARSPGSFLDNLNRWRGQIGLEPLSDPSAAQTNDIAVGDVAGRVVEIVNEHAGVTMRVAMADHGDDRWFFKLTGPSAVVNDQKDEFDNFLKSVQFDGGK